MTMTMQSPAAAQSMSHAVIEMRGVDKWYSPEFQVLKNCTTKVDKGEVVVVCGPSGSGKSTLIKCVNALEPFQKGDIFVTGVKVNDPVDKPAQAAFAHRHGVPEFRAVSASDDHGQSLPCATQGARTRRRRNR